MWSGRVPRRGELASYRASLPWSYLVSYRFVGVETGAVIPYQSGVQDTTARIQRLGFHASEEYNLDVKAPSCVICIVYKHHTFPFRPGYKTARSKPRIPIPNPPTPRSTSFSDFQYRDRGPQRSLDRLRLYAYVSACIHLHNPLLKWRRSASRATPPRRHRIHDVIQVHPHSLFEGINGRDNPTPLLPTEPRTCIGL